MQKTMLENEGWVNSSENFDKLPEPMPKICGYMMLVKPINVEEKTSGGIYIPDQTKSALNHLMSVGKVIKQGPECYKNQDGSPREQWCKEGDWVVWKKLSGINFEYQTQKFKIINDDEVIMVLV